jgi:hypothetical protein
MAYPEGMTPKKGCDALRLIGSLYGLKQSGRTWWIELGKGLEALGFMRTESGLGLYYRTKSKDRGPALLLAYVDDIVVAAESSREIDEVMNGLSRRWMEDYGDGGDINHPGNEDPRVSPRRI